MTVIVQQPYNLFAQQKMAAYPNSEDKHKNPYADRAAAQEAVNRDASIGYGGAPDIDKAGVSPEAAAFAAVKQAANSQTGAVYTPVVETKTTPVVTKTTPQAFTPLDTRSSTAGMDYLNSLYTSPQEEERLRKASVTNQRILAIGDAVRHIGNIANTVGYATSQQFNDPVALAQAKYEKGKALRDKANLTYLTYQQQKAAQDAAQRKWEQQFGLQKANLAAQNAYRQGQLGIAAENAANRKAYQEGQLALGKERNKNTFNHQSEMQRQGRERIGISKQNATNLQNYRQWRMKGGGSGSGVAPLDTPNGQITPNGKNYSNQLLQMFDYAKSKGYVQESDVAKRLREMGFGKDQSDNVKRQMVMDLLRTNQDMGDYASSRLGWTYGTGGGNAASDDMDLGLDGEDDEMDLGLE